MNNYTATVDDAGRIVLLTSLKEGERVHVIIETEKESEEKRLLKQHRAAELFKQIRDRMADDPNFQSFTEESIAEEIAAYRRSE